MIWIAIMDASKGEEDRLKTFENYSLKTWLKFASFLHSRLLR